MSKGVKIALVVVIVLLLAGGGAWWYMKRRKQDETTPGGAAKPGGASSPAPSLSQMLSNNVPNVVVPTNPNCTDPMVLKLGSKGARVEELNHFILQALLAKYPERAWTQQLPETKQFIQDVSNESQIMIQFARKMRGVGKTDFDSLTLAAMQLTTGFSQIKYCDLQILLQGGGS